MTVLPTGAWDGRALAHEAFLYDDDDAVAARVVPFVHEGLERDEPVLVVAGERVRGVLADRLGADTARLRSVAPAESWWRGGHATLFAYDQDLRVLEATGKPWRLVAEPVWMHRPEGHVWSRFEAVANRCYAEMPYYSLCMHDTSQLEPDVAHAALRTHPLTWDGTQPVPSPYYEAPEAFLRDHQGDWSPRPADAVTTSVATVAAARRLVRAAAVSWETVDAMELAVHELVANALHAAGAADVSHWVADDVMVWEVSDLGPGLPDLTAGYVPPALGGERGRGLWLARSLADDAALQPDGAGTAIRLLFRAGGR